MLYQLAWLQLVAEKRRLLAALAGISFAVMLQLMQFGFRDAMFESATALHDRLVADLILTSSLYENVVSPGRIPERRLTRPSERRTWTRCGRSISGPRRSRTRETAATR